MKFSTFFWITLYLIVGIVNGEIHFCFEFDSKQLSENKGNLEEVPALLQNVSKEIRQRLGAHTINYNQFYLKVSHPAVTAQVNFTNGTLSIEDPTIRLWTPTEKGFEIFNLTFPYIFVNGSYDGNGYVGANRLFDIYGNGTFSFQMTNFSVTVLTGLAINSTTLCIPLSVNLYLQGIKSYLNNLMNGDDELEPLVNGVLQSILPEAVPIIFRDSIDQVDPFIQEIIDKYMHGSKSESFSKLLYILANNRDQIDLVLKNAFN